MLVVWEWEHQNLEEHHHLSSSSSVAEQGNSDEEILYEDISTNSTHKLTFKCIGVTRAAEYQSTLRKVRDAMIEGNSTSVKIMHEPTNPQDSQALAFVCEIDEQWHTIGYVIRELIEEVHSAMNSGDILSVEFSWVRYITDWSRSGPGFFAGISIEKKGRWSDTAVRYASTR